MAMVLMLAMATTAMALPVDIDAANGDFDAVAPSGGGGGSVDDSNKITFVAGDDYELTAQKGTSKKADGSVVIETSSSIISQKKIPTVIPNSANEKLVGWAVMDKNGKLQMIDLTTYRFTKDTKVYAVLGAVESSSVADCPKDSTCPIYPYKDASPTAWYHDGVHYCIANKLMNGTSATTFSPNGTTTRQQIWMVLARISGERPANMAEARVWAMENGVSDGTNPAGHITRQQLATMLYRFAVSNGWDVSAGEDTNILSYKDAGSVSEYAVSAIQWACGVGVMGGYSDGTLRPTNTATRAHMAAMLQRFCEKTVK